MTSPLTVPTGRIAANTVRGFVSLGCALVLGAGGIPAAMPGAGPTSEGRSPTEYVATLSGADPATGSGAASSSGPASAAGYEAPVRGDLLRAFDPPDVAWGAGHRGVDLAAAVGAGVGAPHSGTVAFAGRVAGRGVLTILGDDGLRSSLEPVDPLVAVGDHVTRGQVVALLDASATDPAVGHCAPLPCLHWGVRRGETYLDPWALLATGPVVLLPDDTSGT